MNTLNWMSQIVNKVKLVDMLIPGTHDSATAGGKLSQGFGGAVVGAIGSSIPFVKTQDWDIQTQLNNGVRFLDVRVKRDGGGYYLVHGDFPVGLYHENFLTPAINFLASHPQETLIVSIKNDSSIDATKQTFDDSDFNKLTSRGPWYNSSKSLQDLTLGDVRGKMVCLNRMSPNGGYKWEDQDTQDDFELDTHYTEVVIIPHVPAVYTNLPVVGRTQVTPEIKERTQRTPTGGDYGKKARAIKTQLEKAIRAKNRNKFYINFASAILGDKKLWAVPGIGNCLTDNAKYQNNFLHNFFSSYTGAIGSIVIMDHPNQGLINLLIERNAAENNSVKGNQPTPSSSPHSKWVSLGGGGTDIAIDDNGRVWVIGGGNAIFYYDTSWNIYKNKGVRIACAAQAGGLPWIISTEKDAILQNKNGYWVLPPNGGTGIDIAVDEKDMGWAIGTDNRIYFNNGTTWPQYPGNGTAKRIAVQANGTPFVIGTDDHIYKGTGSGWQAVSGNGKGKDLAVDGSGKIWVIGTNDLIYYHEGGSWHEYPGGMKGQAIAASRNGKIAIIAANGAPHVLK